MLVFKDPICEPKYFKWLHEDKGLDSSVQIYRNKPTMVRVGAARKVHNTRGGGGVLKVLDTFGAQENSIY